MKKVIFGLIATILLTNFSFGQRVKSNDLINVGVEHNKMLDIAFKKITNDKLTSKDKDVLVNSLVDYLQSLNNYSKEDIELGKNNLKKTFTYKFDTTNNLYTNEYSNKIDSDVKFYLDKLNKIVDSEIISIKDFNNRVTLLETEIDSNLKLKNEQLIILYSATNVAKFSNEYWTNNITTWSNLNSTLSKADPKNKKSQVLKNDIAGAVGGAAGAWVVNIIPIWGQVSYGSAILGGAVAGSVGTACLELMDSWGWD